MPTGPFDTAQPTTQLFTSKHLFQNNDHIFIVYRHFAVAGPHPGCSVQAGHHGPAQKTLFPSATAVPTSPRICLRTPHFRPLFHCTAGLLGCLSKGSEPDKFVTTCIPKSCMDVRSLS